MEDMVKKRAIVKSGGKIDPNQVSEEVFLFNPDGSAYEGGIIEGTIPSPPEHGTKQLISTDEVLSWEDIEEELPTPIPQSGKYSLIAEDGGLDWDPSIDLPSIEESGTYTLKTIDGVLTWVADGGGE